MSAEWQQPDAAESRPRLWPRSLLWLVAFPLAYLAAGFAVGVSSDSQSMPFFIAGSGFVACAFFALWIEHGRGWSGTALWGIVSVSVIAYVAWGMFPLMLLTLAGNWGNF